RIRDVQLIKGEGGDVGNPQTAEQARTIRTALARHGDTWWTMCCTGMMPDELWGAKWKVGPNCIAIMGTKRADRKRKVPRIWTPTRPTPETPGGFAKALVKATGGAVVPYDGRRTFMHWMEEAGITRTRRKLYMGHRAKDVSDLYERHDLAAYLDSDAELLRKYLGEQRRHLEVVRR
ncbi:MAG: hypothetical protein O7I93_18765, partial [Gemmatimonadetes bacterium]|nr:hypothetical protein [Gemmatimonadota bacterium]